MYQSGTGTSGGRGEEKKGGEEGRKGEEVHAEVAFRFRIVPVMELVEMVPAGQPFGIVESAKATQTAVWKLN